MLRVFNILYIGKQTKHLTWKKTMLKKRKKDDNRPN